MKLSIALTASASVLASIQTVKADGFTPTCNCDRRSRLLMGLEPFEDENGRVLIPSPGGTAGTPGDPPAEASPVSSNLFDGGEYPACDGFVNPSSGQNEAGGEISDEAACCECEPGLYVPEAICCLSGGEPGGGAPYGPGQGGNGGQRSLTSLQVRPQGSPSHEDLELLSNDVGIWKLHNFLDEDEVKALKSAFERASDMHYDCKIDHCRPKRGLSHCQDNQDRPSLIQPYGKQCLLVTNDVKAELAPEDAFLWDALTRKYQSVWPEYTFHSPMLAQLQEGETGPFKFHVDGETLHEHTGYVSPVTILLYLTDGGAATYFPKANDGEGVLVTPKAGMAITYYDIDDQGKPLKRSVHGVIPSGPEDGVRISVQNKFTYVPDLEEAFW